MKDGELRMSQRKLHRLHIVRLTIEGRESVGSGAKFLGISVRQVMAVIGEQTPTQVGQALRALGIEPIFAMFPQAKGRVERLFNTLQDRLVQEFRLQGITTTSKSDEVSQ